MSFAPIKFGAHYISQVESTKFLGIYIDEHRNFKLHIDNIMKKLSKSVGILYKMSQFLPFHILLTLYNTLILPYFNYGIQFYHNAPNHSLNRLKVSQKKAVRAICRLEYNAHTNEHFKINKILKLDDIYRVSMCSTMYSYIENPEIHPLSSRLVRNSDFHTYNTRNRDEFAVPRYSRASSQACFLYRATTEWNTIPQAIKDSRTTHSFKNQLKKYLLSQY